MTIGDKITQIAKKRDMTIYKIAKGSEISQSYMNEIANNIRKNPSVHIVKKIAEYLGMSMDELMEGCVNE